MVAHACPHSYAGSSITVQPAQAKTMKSITKITKAKRAGGIAHVIRVLASKSKNLGF
jgi:hypothetical protein